MGKACNELERQAKKIILRTPSDSAFGCIMIKAIGYHRLLGDVN